MSEEPPKSIISRLKPWASPIGILAVLIIAYSLYHAEPRYDGRSFSGWMTFYEEGISPKRAEAAIYSMGPDAVPHLASRFRQRSGLVSLVRRQSLSLARWMDRWLPLNTRSQGLLPQSIIAEDILKRAPDSWKPAVLESMKDILEHGNPFEQKPALRVLENDAHNAGAVVPALRNILQTPQPDVEFLKQLLNFVHAMGKVSQPVGPELIALFSHPDPSVQSKAVSVASRIELDVREVMPALKPFLDAMPGSHQRRVAVKTLANIAIPDTEQMDYLKVALDDPSEDIRFHAAQGLGRLGEKAIDHLDALIPLLNDEVIGVRESAANAIGNMGPKAARAIPHLIQTMNNDFSGVGQQCRRAIEKIDPSQAEHIIVR